MSTRTPQWLRPPHLSLAIAATTALAMAAIVEAGPFRNPWRQRTTVEHLAEKIDRLGKHIDEYGTVVPKHPDVWGDGRLTRHRVDIENELKKDLSTFEFRLNATVTESDSAFLGEALALSAIADGATALGATNPPSNPQTASATMNLISSPTSTSEPGETNQDNVILRTNPDSPTFAGLDPDKPKVGITLEPTLVLDQKNRYLQHLNELRRMNEGDDTADSPGYALHLVRFPISILPGRKTSHGYGAEITMTATPHLSDELLPSTMRDLVINSIVDDCARLLSKMATATSTKNIAAAMKLSPDVNNPDVNNRVVIYQRLMKGYAPMMEMATGAEVDKALVRQFHDTGEFGAEKLEQLREYLNSPRDASPQPTMPGAIAQFSAGAPNPGSPTVPLNQSFNEASLVLMQVALDASIHLGSELRPGMPLSLLNVRGYLRREVGTAYKLMADPETAHLWAQFCDDGLFSDLRYQRADALKKRREQFFTAMESIHDKTPYFPGSSSQPAVVASLSKTSSCLAWLIMVHAASVNQSLKNDMREVAAHKNCPCVVGEHLSFVGPHPDPEAVAVFNEYVRCRWPVIVFALDPANQEQNIGLSASRRREMQLVAAIAAARGNVSLQSLTRFVRRLEMDLATIDLNRTDIGFSHGNDTFGWRFRPRLQSPAIESNLKVATRDLLIGGPNHEDDLKHRKLEPGIRECTAVVLMPSFVPYVTFDSRANWFRLDNPDCCVYRTSKLLPVKTRVMDLEDSVELSREITAVRSLSQACVNDAHLYRDGEVHRLVRSVEQLDRSLPLQTAYVQIPFDGDITPSDVFERGASGQAPRLEGWYGEPGIYVDGSLSARASASNRLSTIRTTIERLRVALLQARVDGRPADVITSIQTDLTNAQAAEAAALTDANQVAAAIVPKTTLFLVGKHFSLFNMQIMAGGVDITPSVVLMSRNLCQVSIPASVGTTVEKDDSGKDIEVVDVHVATTYGLTSRLSIPVVKPIAPARAAASVSADDVKKLSDRVATVESAAARLSMSWETDYTLSVTANRAKDGSITIDGNAALNRRVADAGTMVVLHSAEEDTPFDPKNLPPQASFAAWIANSKTKEIKAVLGPMSITNNGAETGVTVKQLQDHLAKAIRANPGILDWSESKATLNVTGFVRIPGEANRPTYRIEKSLTIQLDLMNDGAPGSIDGASRQGWSPTIDPHRRERGLVFK